MWRGEKPHRLPNPRLSVIFPAGLVSLAAASGFSCNSVMYDQTTSVLNAQEGRCILQCMIHLFSRDLRDRIEMTQARFAELIGASLDTVKSWERRRKPHKIGESFQERILWETGAIFERGSIKGSWRFLNEKFANKSYTKDHFVYWRECLARSDKAKVADLIGQGQAAVELLLNAAINRKEKPLRAVWQSFEAWFAQTSKDFNLRREIARLAPKGATGPVLGAIGPYIWFLPTEIKPPHSQQAE